MVKRLAMGVAVLMVGLTGCNEADSPTSRTTARETISQELENIVEELQGQSLELAQQGDPVPESAFNTESPQTVEEYLTEVIQNLDTTWTRWFLNVGHQEPFVSYKIVTPDEAPSVMGCGQITIVHDTANAYYCSIDELTPGFRGAIYLPVTTFQKMWTGEVLGQPSEQAGDFVAAIVTAHEFGHHVVDEIEIQSEERDAVEYRGPTSPELIADCMAGVWAAWTYYQGLLEPGDFEEAVGGLQAIGDFDITTKHGTPAQREEALLTGYHGLPGITQPGDPAACMRTYW
jgi:predicted metalloprotease